MRIKDAEVKKNLRWHILRQLRLSSQMSGELVGQDQRDVPRTLGGFSRFLEGHLRALPDRAVYRDPLVFEPLRDDPAGEPGKGQKELWEEVPP